MIIGDQMKVKKIFFTVIFLLCIVFQYTSYAIVENNSENVDMTSLEKFSQKLETQGDYMPKIDIKTLINKYKSTGSIGLTFKDFTGSLIKYIFKEVLGNSNLLIELIFISILCAILQNLQTSFAQEGVANIAYYACFLIMTLIIIKSFVLAMQVGKETIDNMVELTNSMMPPLIGLLAVSGGISSAATLDPIIVIAIKVTSDIIRDLIMPMAILVLTLNIVDNLSDNVKITKLADLIKSINMWALGLIMTAFIGAITVRSSASATIDQVALKTTKFAVDNFIPVVGKCLSDAVSTVAGYSLILKDAISIVGLIVMIFICIFPLIKIAIIALIYKFVGAVMEPIVDKKIVNCLSAAGNSLTIVFACVLSVAVMFFIMITIIASTGKLIMMVR